MKKPLEPCLGCSGGCASMTAYRGSVAGSEKGMGEERTDANRAVLVREGVHAVERGNDVVSSTVGDLLDW